MKLLLYAILFAVIIASTIVIIHTSKKRTALDNECKVLTIYFVFGIIGLSAFSILTMFVFN